MTSDVIIDILIHTGVNPDDVADTPDVVFLNKKIDFVMHCFSKKIARVTY